MKRKSRQAAVLLGDDSACLDLVRDPRTSEWRDVVSTAEQLASDAFFVRLRDNAVQPPAEGPRRIVAVVDSGILADHPRLRGMVVDHHDLSGRGTGDEHGHGTLVALILLRGNETTRLWHGLLDVRVCGPNPVTSEAILEQAINWVTAWALDNTNCRVSLNLSIGVRRSGVLRSGCRGRCRVCRAAIRAADAGVSVNAAAGNDRVTTCPAAAAFVHPAISAVTGLFDTAARGTHATEHTVHTAVIGKAGGAAPVVVGDLDSAFGAAARLVREGRTEDAKAVLVSISDHAERLGDLGFLAVAQHDLGRIAYLDGNPTEAERIWRRVIRAGQPAAALAGLSLGILLEETDRRAEAITVLRGTAGPDHEHAGRARCQLGLCLARDGQVAEARVWLNRAAESDDPEVTLTVQKALAVMESA